MSPSEATNQATREEWRELGFFYETRDDPACWRLIGSASGLAKFVKLLDQYVCDPRKEAISEHEHYGPYMYLKVQTAESPEIDGEGIRGSLADLARLRDLIAHGLRNLSAGESFVIGPEYSPSVILPLRVELRESDFDPASEDPALPESA
jgi:hypothetical protein